jgi:hypothetical protein
VARGVLRAPARGAGIAIDVQVAERVEAGRALLLAFELLPALITSA